MKSKRHCHVLGSKVVVACVLMLLGPAGNVVSRYYDSLLSKVISSAPTFDKAVQRMARALQEFQVSWCCSCWEVAACAHVACYRNRQQARWLPRSLLWQAFLSWCCCLVISTYLHTHKQCLLRCDGVGTPHHKHSSRVHHGVPCWAQQPHLDSGGINVVLTKCRSRGSFCHALSHALPQKLT